LCHGLPVFPLAAVRRREAVEHTNDNELAEKEARKESMLANESAARGPFQAFKHANT
jgi:hypothetical protein